MRIDRNKLPTKYVLEVYKMVEGYPSTIDLLYEIVSILEARSKLDAPFTAIGMMKEVSARLNNGEDLEDSLKTLTKEGWLMADAGGYLLVKHPWISETI